MVIRHEAAAALATAPPSPVTASAAAAGQTASRDDVSSLKESQLASLKRVAALPSIESVISIERDDAAGASFVALDAAEAMGGERAYLSQTSVGAPSPETVSCAKKSQPAEVMVLM